MEYSDDRYHLHVEINTKGCAIPPEDRAKVQALLAPVGEAVRNFPASNLTIKVIYHARSDVLHAELQLGFPGQTLFTGDRDRFLEAALERGVRKLVRKIEAYQEHPDRQALQQAEQRLVLDREVVAPEDPNDGPLGEAVRSGDYRSFRSALAPYEEWLRNRVGRWLQRYPEAEAKLHKGLLIGDVVEEVYLNAFEHFAHRPTDVRLSEWLDSWIDSSLKLLMRDPGEESKTISLARTVRSAPLG